MKFGLQLFLAACFCTLALGLAWGDFPPTADNSSSFSQMSSLTNIDINPPPSSDSGLFKSSPSLSEAAAAEDPLPTSNIISQPRRQLNSDEIAALQEKADKESNWLIYGYQEAMRRNSTSHEADNFYFQDASDKTPANSSDATHGATGPGKSAATLPDNAFSKPDGKKEKISFLSDKAFKPFLAPLISSEVMGLNNSSTGGSFFSGSNVELSKKPSLQMDQDEMDNDALTPGLTAARNDPTANPAYLDPALDLLPGESSTHAMAHQDFFTSSELPTGSSLLELQNQQKISMNPPKPLQVAPPAPISPLLLTPQDKDNLSFSKPPGAPAPAPVRPRVADPRDFLNR